MVGFAQVDVGLVRGTGSTTDDRVVVERLAELLQSALMAEIECGSVPFPRYSSGIAFGGSEFVKSCVTRARHGEGW